MLARFERLMERAVEGSLRRVFPTSLQPVQIAKATARAMEEAQVVGIAGPEVPNAYRVRLAPEDLERFADYSTTMTRELRRYVVEYAHERGLRPVGEPRIELVEDERVRVGTVRVDARFVDVEPARRAALEEALEGTRQLRLAQAGQAGSAFLAADADDVSDETEAEAEAEATLWLSDRLGLRYPLDPAAGLVRIGRASDNDVSIDNHRVSRYHSQVRRVASTWLVYDLDSTNGTYVDGERVAPARPRPLVDGSMLRLGDHDLQVGPRPVEG
jgi:hypothetical protein